MNKIELKSMLEQMHETFLTESQIVKFCGKSVNYNGATIKKLLNQLVDSGDVIITERHKFALTERSGLIRGNFVGNVKGFGFVEAKGNLKDIFIPERFTNGAVHGDEVLAKILPQRKGAINFFRKTKPGESQEGEIVRILKRNLTQIVGVYSLIGGGGVVIPDDKRFTDQVFIPMGKSMDARANNKVVVKLTTYPSRNQMAIGEVVEVLGDINEEGVDTLSIVRSFGITEKFPDEVIKEADKVAVEPTEEDLKGRKDFRKDLVITIDGEDARDFDDAISLTKVDDKFRLCVHIADVSHYVKLGGEIDKEAFNRGTSVYFPDMVIPMLPEKLCNDVCSLNPNVDRLTLSVIMLFDEKGVLKNYEICDGVIKSSFRMTYTKVAKIFEGDKAVSKEYKQLLPMLSEMKKLAELLIKRRDEMGELDFDLPEVQIDMDEHNKIKDIYRKPRTMADRLIEQFMIVTNETVARHIRNLELPFVYRVHEIPTTERLHAFNDYVNGIGLNLTVPEVDPKPIEVQKVLKTVKGKPMQVIIGNLLLRSMQKARYYEKPLGHFGLALKDYCHFTSPIRRYPDLTIHRIIKLSISNKFDNKAFDFFEEFVHDASEQSSEREKVADEAEREVDDLKKTEYMQGKIGEEYPGIISGVTENGFFVELENTVEGFVNRVLLPSDNYYYDPTKMALLAKNHKYRLGQSVKIKVLRTDLVARKIDFSLVEEQTLKNTI